MSFYVTTANTDWASGGDGSYIRHLCADANLVLVQEAKDTRLADVIPDGWTALQDCSGRTRSERQAHMGSAILFRKDTLRLREGTFNLKVGTTPKGRAMLTRYIATATLIEVATGRPFKAISCHLPPSRFKALQPPMAKALRTVVNHATHAVVVGTDANMPIGRLASTVGLDAFGRGIVGVLTDATVLGHVAVDTWGERKDKTDHPAIRVKISLPKDQP